MHRTAGPDCRRADRHRAIGADQAEAITDPFRLALGVRHLHPIASGRMLPFRDETVTGELYVMSLVLTAAQVAF